MKAKAAVASWRDMVASTDAGRNQSRPNPASRARGMERKGFLSPTSPERTDAPGEVGLVHCATGNPICPPAGPAYSAIEMTSQRTR